MLQGKVMCLVVFALGLILLTGVAGCSKDDTLKVKKLEPKEGSWEGGDAITIHGSGFGKGGTKSVKVFFGEEPARVQNYVSDDKIIVVAPGGTKNQTVDVMLVFADSRRIEIKDAFKYIDSTAGYGIDEMTKK